MKKLGLIGAVLLVVAAPVLASVDITCARDGNMITVSYTVVGYPTTEPNKVRAFALDIMVDSPAWINDVNNTDPNYWVYPGSIVILNGEVNNVGTPVANPYDPCLPGGTLPGLDHNGITIEMGSLYYPTGDNSPNAPKTGTRKLLKFKVCHVFNNCRVRIRENTARGGVVMTNPTLDPVVNSPGYTFVLGPACWTYECFTNGDANGDCKITATDVGILKAAWPPKAYNQCADFNKDGKITATDVGILKNHWPPKVTCAVGCVPGPH